MHRLLLGLALVSTIFGVRAEQFDGPSEENELECLAKNIYFESRDQTLRGQIAIALVTMNRVNSKYYPSSVCGVVKQAIHYPGTNTPKRYKCQFSWYCDGKSDRPKDLKAYDQAIQVASSILDKDGGQIDDFTNGSLNYHANYVYPYWAKGMKVVARVGDHVFLIKK